MWGNTWFFLTFFQTALEVVSENLSSLDNRLRKHKAQNVATSEILQSAAVLILEAVQLGSC